MEPTKQAAPAVPENKYVDIGDGLKVHFHEQGTGDVVLFLHGSGPGASGWSNFRRNYPVFAEAGFRALVPDTLGYGYSSKPDNLDYDLDFLVGGVERFLKGLGVTQIVLAGVATSMGVESTARHAHELGFHVALAVDAMTDLHLDAHNHSVTRIFPRLGENGTTHEILELLKKRFE